jgi:glycosyltransferase involved in cell wall biosynthesis
MKSANETLGVPIVSIAMPVYNGEAYIKQAIDSLLAQTFKDFELIISDNASTDATEPICRKYAEQDLRVRYIRQDENLGAMRNFQFVLNQARCDYFMWAACDDVWDSSWLCSLYNEICKNKKAAVFGRVVHIDELSRRISHPATKNLFDFSGSILKRKVNFFLEFEGKGKANLFYSLFRKEDFRDANLIQYKHDYYALFDWLNNIQFLSIDNIFIYKRIHSTSEGVAKQKPMLLKLLDVLILRTLFNSLGNAKGYLNYSHGIEKLILIALIPIKIFLDHVFQFQRILIKLFKPFS